MALLAASGCDGFVTDHLGKAQAAYEAGNFREARIHFINRLQEAPDEASTVIMYARTMLELGDGIGAAAALEKIAGDAEHGPEARALLPRALAISEKYDAVLELTGDVSGPHAADLAWARASALAVLERAGEAEETVSKGLEANPGHVELTLLKGSLALNAGDIEGARKIGAALVQAAPDDPLVLIYCGRMARIDGDEKAARKLLLAALAKRPEHPQLLKELGDSHRQTGELDRARSYYARALEIAPRNPVTLAALAELELFDGKPDLALEILQSDEKAIEATVHGRRLAGLVAEQRGNKETARSKLQRYLRDHPDDPIALAAVDRIAGKRDSAERPDESALAASMRTASDGVKAAMAQAGEAAAAQRWKEADRLYTALVAGEGAANPAVLNNASMVKMQLGDIAGALTLAKKAYDIAPGDPFVQDSYGWALFANGKGSQRAADLILEAWRGAPDNLEITWHLAQILAANGREAEAKSILRELRPKLSANDRSRIDGLIAQL